MWVLETQVPAEPPAASQAAYSQEAEMESSAGTPTLSDTPIWDVGLPSGGLTIMPNIHPASLALEVI